MLPGPLGRRVGGLPDYLRRALRFPQMDLEYTFWQMVYLCFDPKRVYKNTSYHKQTKNQWARDDPAFTVLCMCFLFVAAVAYTVAFQVSNPLVFLRVVLGAILFDFVLLGVVIASATWALSNKYLKVHSLHSVEQDVEWLYAYDVHCNSFFPMFLIVYVLQFFMLPFLLREGFLPTLVANSIYAAAFIHYHYITFLGYNALPFLRDAVYFLYPAGVVIVLYIISLLLGINCSILTMNLYFS